MPLPCRGRPSKLGGKPHGEACSLTRAALDLNRSAMLIHSPFDETQSQASAVSAIAAGWIGAIKPFKNVRDSFWRDAYAIICDVENGVGPNARNFDLDIPARRGEFDRIISEVENDALDPPCVASKYDIGIATA